MIMNEERIFEINNIEDLSQVSDLLIEWRDKSNIIALYGTMGAGKTTLIKNLCKKLGVQDEVNSPTFALVNEYQTDTLDSIFHFDFYRINRLQEAYEIGLEEYFSGEGLCFVEWPEKIEELLPEDIVKVSISASESGSRSVLIEF